MASNNTPSTPSTPFPPMTFGTIYNDPAAVQAATEALQQANPSGAGQSQGGSSQQQSGK